MARMCLFLLLPLLPSLASRLQGRPASHDSAGDAWRGVAGLPAVIIRQVVELVPRLPVVAWKTADGVWRFVRPGTQHSDWVLGGEERHHIEMRFWPSGDRVLTWSPWEEWNATVWDVWTGRPLQTLQHSTLAPGDGGGIRDAQVFRAGDRLATLGSDGIVIVWDVAGEALQHFDVNVARWPRRIHWLGATQLAIAGGSSDGDFVDIWDLVSDSTLRELRAPRGMIQRLEISPCGSKLLTVGRNAARLYHFCLWDVAMGSMQWERELEWDRNDWNGVFFPDVSEVIVSRGGVRVVVKVGDARGSGAQVVVLVGSTGEPRSRLRLGSRVDLVGLLAGGRHVAAISSEEAAVWDTETGERLFSLESDARLLGQYDEGRLAVSPCGQVVAFCGQQVDAPWDSSSADVVESLAMWDGRSGRMLFRRERRAHVLERAVRRCRVEVAAMTVMADELFD